jgi:preprotein translocase subunit SecG
VETYVNIVQIVISIVLVGVIALQARGSGFSATFTSDSSIYRTRRGVEKTLFNFTIVLAVAFVLISLASFFFNRL